MSEAASVQSPIVRKDNSFFLRKLHSLTGIVPVGGFLIFHLVENLKAANSPEVYNTAIKDLWNIAPRQWFYIGEVGLLFVPILFHSIYGFYIWYTGAANATHYRYRRNWMYSLQRWSGLIAFLYMGYHVWTLRFAPGVFRPTDDTLTKWMEVQEAIIPGWATAIYLLGNISAAFHLGNGLWGFAYSWGLAVGRRAQQLVELAGWGLFLLLSAMSIHIIVAFHTMH
jgi:succinate dehydrogenase / fumarate reductase, cytochrome b subunit